MAKVTPTATAAGTPKPARKAAPREGANRIKFANIGSKDPAVYPFKVVETKDEAGTVIARRATPVGYDHDKHESLSRDDFSKPSAFKLFRAERLESKAKKFRDEAETMIKTGDGAGGGKANRLVKMLNKAQELQEELKRQGIDVDALLALTKAASAAKEEAPAAV